MSKKRRKRNRQPPKPLAGDVLQRKVEDLGRAVKPATRETEAKGEPEKKRLHFRTMSLLVFFSVLITVMTAYPLYRWLRNGDNPAEKNDWNVLVVTLDTTRADAVGLYSHKNDVTPHLDELGRGGLVFEECYSPVPLTLPAHCSLFTGRYPLAHRVRNNGTYFLDEGELTLAEVFRQRGYQTAAVVSSFTVFSKFGLGQGFDFYDEDFGSGKTILNFDVEIPADRVYEKFSRLFSRRPEKAFFYWVHFYDPHAPYLSHGDPAGGEESSAWSRYEGEVRFVDEFVGKIIDDLKSGGLYENTVVLIVGDHGEAFGEHKEEGHGIFCYEESLRVPLIIHNPRLFKTPARIAERVRLVDVMPTVLDVFGLKIPREIQGRSFLDLVKKKTEKKAREVYFESLFGQEENNWAPLTGIIDGRFKYISLPEPELYDLQSDPGEARNLIGRQSDRAREMDKALEQFIRHHAAAKSPAKRELSPSDVERLKTLGYVSGFSGRAKEMIDPKRAMDIYLETAEVKQLIRLQDFGRAGERLAAILSRNPGVELPDIYEISYQIQRHRGEVNNAVATLQKAIGLFPDNESFKVFLGMFYIESGEYSAAEDHCLQLLAANEKMTTAHILLGDARVHLNKLEAALSSYKNALALEPQNGMIKVKIAETLARKGDLSGAQAALEELEGRPSIVLTPEYMAAMADLAWQFLSSGEGEKGLMIYRRAAAINPDSPDVWLNLGSAYLSQGRYDLALENFEKARALAEDYAVIYSNIGVVYMSRFAEENDPTLADKALGYFNRAIELQPDLATAYNGRGWTLSALKRIPQALRDFERSIELDPDGKDAYINISLALYQLGRYADALKYLDVVRAKFREQLSPQDREEVERLYARIKALEESPSVSTL
jgi:arylsulfatase A-like enzyme/Tfp pilus assembly protein PilF